MRICCRVLILATLALVIVPSATEAQTKVYVVGQLDDPATSGNSGPQTLSVIDVATNAIVTSISLGTSCHCVGPDLLAVSPDGSRVYAANEIANSVFVLDTSSNSVVSTIAVGTGPIAIAVSPNGSRVYVVNGSGTTSVSVIDAATNMVIATIPLGVIQARGVAVRPDGTRLYVSTYGSNSVKVINTASNSVVNTIPVGSLPVGLGFTPDGGRAYVANYLGMSVSVIDAVSETVIATVPLTSFAQDVAVTADGLRAYIANNGTSVIDTQTNALSGSVPGTSGNSLDAAPDGTRVYLASFSSVQAINTSNNSVVATIPFDEVLRGHPVAIAMGAGQAAPASTSTTLAVSSAGLVFGETVTLTASVSASSGTPTGSVEFFDGATSLGTASLSGGSATLATNALGLGTHSLSAAYAGDTGFSSSSASSVPVTVNRAQTTISVVTSPNPSTRRQVVTVTVTVAAIAPGAGTPTGEIELFEKKKSLGVATLVNGVASLQVVFRNAGEHNLTARYAGDLSFLGGASPISVQSVVR